MAGRVSKSANAKLLVLNHISSKSNSKGERDTFEQKLIEDAKVGSDGTSQVLVSYDFMELLVPWMGFGCFTDETIEEDTKLDLDSVEDTKEDILKKPKTVLNEIFGKKDNKRA